MAKRRIVRPVEKTRCRFCRSKLMQVDYKDLLSLQKLTTPQGKMFSRKRSGNCARHQRRLKISVKQARSVALLPFAEAM